MKDPYKTLGVTHSATAVEIRDAYYRLARQYIHLVGVQPNEEQMKEIEEAYATIGDQDKRREYDKKRTVPMLRQAVSSVRQPVQFAQSSPVFVTSGRRFAFPDTGSIFAGMIAWIVWCVVVAIAVGIAFEIAGLADYRMADFIVVAALDVTPLLGLLGLWLRGALTGT